MRRPGAPRGVRLPGAAIFGAAPAAATALLVLAGLSWGLSFSLNRLATTHGVPVPAYVFWQALGGALVLMLATAAAGRRPPINRRFVLACGVPGALGLGLPFLALAFVADKLPAGVVGLGQALVPMLTYAFALALGIERRAAVRLAGLALGLVGVALIVVPRTSLPEPGMAGWVLVGLTAPLLYGLANVLAALFRPPEVGSLPLAAGLLVAGAAIVFPVMAATGTWWFFDNGLDAGGLAVIAIALLNALFWYLFYEIIRLAGPVFFASFNYITPLAGVMWGIVFFGDSHSAWIWGALVLMLAGLFLVITAPHLASRLARRVGRR